MTRPKNQKADEIEANIESAITALKGKEFPSVQAAAKHFKVPRSTLQHRINGRVMKKLAHEADQCLTHTEELELKRWITELTIKGYAPRHQIIREMAEEIRKQRIRNINEVDIEYVSYPPLGEAWPRNFMHRHPELETRLLRTIDAARVKDTTHEACTRWFQSFEQVISSENILRQNIYNMDESGFSISVTQAARVIINSKIRTQMQAHPGRQEWVSVVECICGDGTAIPPLVIFKGKSFSQSWLPDNVDNQWRFACNTNGWTSNIHGYEWMRRCFEPTTREKANGNKRLLICDGHESHITGRFIAHCFQSNITLMILPPHSSHFTQPLDLAVFSPLKTAMATEIDRIIRTGISRLQKAEWLAAFVNARASAFTSSNIRSAWTAAGLIPYNPSKVLNRIPQPPSNPEPTRPVTPVTESPFDDAFLNSSPAGLIKLHNANEALIGLVVNNQPLDTPARNHVVKLAKSSERLYTRTTILQRERNDIQDVVSARKRRASGKRRLTLEQHVMTQAEIFEGILAEEAKTAAKRRKVGKGRGKEAEKACTDAQEIDSDTDQSVQDVIVISM